jgi:hypothetical protein
MEKFLVGPMHAARRRSHDQWWEWAEKPLESPMTILTEIHEAVMALPRTNAATVRR